MRINQIKNRKAIEEAVRDGDYETARELDAMSRSGQKQESLAELVREMREILGECAGVAGECAICYGPDAIHEPDCKLAAMLRKTRKYK